MDPPEYDRGTALLGNESVMKGSPPGVGKMFSERNSSDPDSAGPGGSRCWNGDKGWTVEVWMTEFTGSGRKMLLVSTSC